MANLSQLTNKTKKELVYLATSSINKYGSNLSFEVRDRNFTYYIGSILKMERSQVIGYISDMVNESKLWDSLHPFNQIMMESGERFWYNRKLVDSYKEQLEAFLLEFKTAN